MSSFKPKIFPFPRPFLIRPIAGLETSNPYFLNAAQQLVDSLIPESLWLIRGSAGFETLLDPLRAELPIFSSSDLDDGSTSLSITWLCPATHCQQAKRYVQEMMASKLSADKPIEFVSGIHLAFQFIEDPTSQWFIAQDTIAIRSQKELSSFRKKLPELLLELKHRLPKESARQTNIVHPIFMPRNEEEQIRNLIVLASQIKYVRDLPQVSIHYEKQTDVDLTFTIIAASLLKRGGEPLKKKLERSRLKIDIDQIRTMGYLLQKHPKEAAIFHLTVDKQPFFRPDHSVDLLRARQKITLEVQHCLGEFRDFNGGMILKQDEALSALRREIGTLSETQEFLLENYFYSLQPGIMQTIHDPATLKTHFEQLLEISEPGLQGDQYKIAVRPLEKVTLFFILFESPGVKEAIFKAIEPLQISPHHFTHCLVDTSTAMAAGFILRSDSPELVSLFQETLFTLFSQ